MKIYRSAPLPRHILAKDEFTAQKEKHVKRHMNNNNLPSLAATVGEAGKYAHLNL